MLVNCMYILHRWIHTLSIESHKGVTLRHFSTLKKLLGVIWIPQQLFWWDILHGWLGSRDWRLWCRHFHDSTIYRILMQRRGIVWQEERRMSQIESLPSKEGMLSRCFHMQNCDHTFIKYHISRGKEKRDIARVNSELTWNAFWKSILSGIAGILWFFLSSSC